MPGLLKYFACCLLGFILTLSANCQEKSDSLNVHESLMNQYELACEQCINMKSAVSQGKVISRREAQSYINKFISLNKAIKSIQDKLTDRHLVRFQRINQWFATGVRPSALDDSLDTPQIYNDLVTISDSTLVQPTTCAHKLRYLQHYKGKRRIKRPRRSRAYIMASISAPLAYGLRLGIRGNYVGGYVSGRTDFSSVKHSYCCTSNGVMDNGLIFWGSGVGRRSNKFASAGILVKTSKWLDAYAGVGYGYRRIYWRDIEGKWAMVSNLSHKGMAVEAGVIASWKRISLSVGLSTIKFRTASADISIGINF